MQGRHRGSRHGWRGPPQLSGAERFASGTPACLASASRPTGASCRSGVAVVRCAPVRMPVTGAQRTTAELAPAGEAGPGLRGRPTRRGWWGEPGPHVAGLLPAGMSAGAAAQTLDVDDEDRAGLETDPAAGGEVRQGLVDRLAGGADQLGELLLGEAVGDHHAVVRLPAEALGEVQDVLDRKSV